MSVATLNEKLIPILRAATDRVEIQDQNGEVVGYFEPVRKTDYVRQSPFGEDEIRQVMQNKGKGMSLAEALKRIGAK